MPRFVRGREYSRAEVTDIVVPSPAAKGGKWDTGILEHAGEFFIFANVGTPGRTGHDYSNRWEGSRLRWYHKRGSHLGWPSVRRLIQPRRDIHVFWRVANRTAFKYAGRATPWTIENTTPVEILWSFDTPNQPRSPSSHGPALTFSSPD